ncbi:MAG TPA: hypothetical protein VIC32_08935 [Terriglobales bacterium]|jgi:hypothetical protein
MRTTLSIDDAIYEKIKLYAHSRSLSFSRAASELMASALSPPRRYRLVNGLPVMDLPHDAPTITTEQVREILADEIW